MKNLDLFAKEKICGAYMCLAALISFLTLSPWYEIVKYDEADASRSYTPFEFLRLHDVNRAYQIVLMVFYVLLFTNFLCGVLMLFMGRIKKNTLITPAINFFLYIVLTYLSLCYFSKANGLNAPAVILSLVGIALVGYYFVNSLSNFIVYRMEKQAKKRIKK